MDNQKVPQLGDLVLIHSSSLQTTYGGPAGGTLGIVVEAGPPRYPNHARVLWYDKKGRQKIGVFYFQILEIIS